jgi:hypothetical protein
MANHTSHPGSSDRPGMLSRSARSSTDRASGYGPGGWGFDSLRARQETLEEADHHFSAEIRRSLQGYLISMRLRSFLLDPVVTSLLLLTIVLLLSACPGGDGSGGGY